MQVLAVLYDQGLSTRNYVILLRRVIHSHPTRVLNNRFFVNSHQSLRGKPGVRVSAESGSRSNVIICFILLCFNITIWVVINC